ncbi:hypothetical protein ABLB96_15105 [Acinetobacter sp. XH1741]
MDKFEEALQHHKDSLAKELIKLGKNRQVDLAEWDIEQNQADYEYYFEAGRQSQQAKVEELQQDLEAQREETIKGYTKISDLRLERDELQKRVDSLEAASLKALAWFDQKYMGETGLESMLWVGKAKEARDELEQALKGEENA